MSAFMPPPGFSLWFDILPNQPDWAEKLMAFTGRLLSRIGGDCILESNGDTPILTRTGSRIVVDDKKLKGTAKFPFHALKLSFVEGDLEKCRKEGVWMVFAPSDPGEVYRPVPKEQQAKAVLDSMSVKLRSFTTPVGGLSGGQRQGIAICRALVSDPRLVILDEPTAALGISQRAEVLDLIVRLKQQNRGVLVISHDLKDVQHVADRVVVLRLGSKVAEFVRGSYSSSELVAAITGAHEGVA